MKINHNFSYFFLIQLQQFDYICTHNYEYEEEGDGEGGGEDNLLVCVGLAPHPSASLALEGTRGQLYPPLSLPRSRIQ